MSTVLLILLILACPLMMIFMMRGHGHGHGHGGHDGATSRTDGTHAHDDHHRHDDESLDGLMRRRDELDERIAAREREERAGAGV